MDESIEALIARRVAAIDLDKYSGMNRQAVSERTAELLRQMTDDLPSHLSSHDKNVALTSFMRLLYNRLEDEGIYHSSPIISDGVLVNPSSADAPLVGVLKEKRGSMRVRGFLSRMKRRLEG